MTKSKVTMLTVNLPYTLFVKKPLFVTVANSNICGMTVFPNFSDYLYGFLAIGAVQNRLVAFQSRLFLNQHELAWMTDWKISYWQLVSFHLCVGSSRINLYKFWFHRKQEHVLNSNPPEITNNPGEIFKSSLRKLIQRLSVSAELQRKTINKKGRKQKCFIRSPQIETKCPLKTRFISRRRFDNEN